VCPRRPRAGGASHGGAVMRGLRWLACPKGHRPRTASPSRRPIHNAPPTPMSGAAASGGGDSPWAPDRAQTVVPRVDALSAGSADAPAVRATPLTAPHDGRAAPAAVFVGKSAPAIRPQGPASPARPLREGPVTPPLLAPPLPQRPRLTEGPTDGLGRGKRFTAHPIHGGPGREGAAADGRSRPPQLPLVASLRTRRLRSPAGPHPPHHVPRDHHRALARLGWTRPDA